MRVLVVDDEEFARDVLAYALRRDGYDVTTVASGAEALRLLSEQEFRLVISDWEMPEIDGLELCRRVRRTCIHGYVYVILLTGRTGTQSIVEGLSAGADDFLSKPFHAAELRVRLRAAERVLALETRDVAIFALAKLAESRDPETGAHLERVRAFVRLLAEQLRESGHFPEIVNEEFTRLMYLTSPLHDIGKVGIPDSILLKPGRLSAREFEIMKSHTLIGAETLGAAARAFPRVPFLSVAREIALTHHERFNGEGYPSGLSGDQIPLSGRIMALADVYDALTSKRVYKQAMAHEVAREIILGESGSHFDPRIVEAFRAVEFEFIDVRSRFAEAEVVAT